jgi:hypothetical protein
MGQVGERAVRVIPITARYGVDNECFRTLYDSERLVAAVAERRVLALLAVAQPDLLCLRQGKLLRAKTGALVAAIAVGLVTAEATGTPPVVSGWEFDGDGLLIVNFGEIFHDPNLAGDARTVKKARRGSGAQPEVFVMARVKSVSVKSLGWTR